MQFITEYIFCKNKLIDSLEEVQEIYSAIKSVRWFSDKGTAKYKTGKVIAWQEANNRLFEITFEKIGGWQTSTVLFQKPMHKGEFLKNGVFVEIQFGNSSTVYRDYYKFHYGFASKLLTLVVLIVPTDPVKFFPNLNPNIIIDMASFNYALEHMSSLTIQVPVLLIGLLPKN